VAPSGQTVPSASDSSDLVTRPDRRSPPLLTAVRVTNGVTTSKQNSSRRLPPPEAGSPTAHVFHLGAQVAGFPTRGGCACTARQQFAADLTDTSYTDAVTRLVLDPIGLTGATLPTRDTDLGLDTVTGYQLTGDGVFQPAAMICTIPAVGGLWATPTDLVRLGLGWTRLLPAELVQEALTAQTPLGAGGRAMGLGWLLSPDRDVGLHAGSGPGATAALLYLTGGQVRVIVSNRAVPLDTVTDRLLHQ
jgi:hypothetical protein